MMDAGESNYFRDYKRLDQLQNLGNQLLPRCTPNNTIHATYEEFIAPRAAAMAATKRVSRQGAISHGKVVTIYEEI